MVLTNSQIINGVGYLQIWVNQAVELVKVLNDPDSSSTDKTNATNGIKTALGNIYKLMNTACQANGWTPPSGTFTAQQLANMGIT